MSDEERSSVENEVFEAVRRDVRAGYLARDEIVENAVFVYSDVTEPAEVEAAAKRALEIALSELQREEPFWPTLTDYDRLEMAFQQLGDSGIVARENFSCCGNCGQAEIWEEVDKATGGRGYTFFHSQDTESAVDGFGLYLNYGAVEEGEAAALEIAREIVERLEGCGLKTDWDGSWGKRIAVRMIWQKRWRCA